MSMRPVNARHLQVSLICAAALLQAGCASTPIQDGNRMMTEVVQLLSRQEILSGAIKATYDNQGREAVKWPWLHGELLKQGWKDEDIVDGSVVLMRTHYYRHNITSGIVRQNARPALIAPGLNIAPGQIVEVEFKGGIPTIARVRHQSLTEGTCEYRLGDRSVVFGFLDAVNPIGGPGTASLYCPAIEAEGWSATKNGLAIEWFKEPVT